MTKKNEKIRSLWPLPGGNDKYLDTLVQALLWLAQKDDETVDEELNAWFQKVFNVGEKTAPGYIDVIKRMGVIDIDSVGKINLTEFGQAIIDADDLRQQAELIVHRFMDDYLAFPEVINVYKKHDEPIHTKTITKELQPQFPRWTSTAQFDYRALWLLSLGCLEQDHGRYYLITEFGRKIADQYPIQFKGLTREEHIKKIPEKELDLEEKQIQIDALIQELKQSARDSKNPERFEGSIAECFNYLGFHVDQLGETGDTDVLLSAEIGKETYRVVIDGKSRSSGKLSDFRSFPLEQHRENNKADFIVVVAEDFAGGNLEQEAVENRIILLPTEVLSKWMKAHSETPLNLSVQMSMFETPGRLSGLSVEIKSANNQRKRWANLIIEMIHLMEETYTSNLLDPLSTDNLFKMLVTHLKGVQYSDVMVEEAVKFLSHEALGNIMKEDEKGVSLQMNLDNAAASLKALAEMLEKSVESLE